MTTDNPKTTTSPSSPALDEILSRVIDDNSRLLDILAAVEAFLVRTLGEGRTEATSTDAPQPEGKLPCISTTLSVQGSLINYLRDAVNVLERIG